MTYNNTRKLKLHIRAVPIWSNVQHEVTYFGSYFLPLGWVLCLKEFLLRHTWFYIPWCCTSATLCMLVELQQYTPITKWIFYNIALIVPCFPLWMTLDITIAKELMTYVGMWFMMFNYVLTSFAVLMYINHEEIESWSMYTACLGLRVLAVVVWLPCYGLTDAFPEGFRRSTNPIIFFCMTGFWIYCLVNYMLEYGELEKVPFVIGSVTIVESLRDLEMSLMVNLCVWSIRFMSYSYIWPDMFLILTSRINCELPIRKYKSTIENAPWDSPDLFDFTDPGSNGILQQSRSCPDLQFLAEHSVGSKKLTKLEF